MVAGHDQAFQVILQLSQLLPLPAQRQQSRYFLLHLRYNHGSAPAHAFFAAQNIAVCVVTKVEDVTSPHSQLFLQKEGVATHKTMAGAVGHQGIFVRGYGLTVLAAQEEAGLAGKANHQVKEFLPGASLTANKMVHDRSSVVGLGVGQ